MPDKQLTTERFIAARNFLKSRARPLDVARFRYAFEGGSPDDVRTELAAFRNADGGFGHGLEPDLRTPHSSVLCTTVACQILQQIGTDTGDPLFAGAIDYFLATFDESAASWRIIPAQADASPHAPWWDQPQGGQRFDAFSLNPTAEVLAYLYTADYAADERVSAQLLAVVSDRVAVALSDADEIEMHQLLCCLRLLRADGLPGGFRRKVQAELAASIAQTVATDPAAWQGYSLRPLDVISRPDSPFLPGLEAAVSANLDFEIDSQNADGSWTPAWSWGDSYPDVWAQARQEWAGAITINKLRRLQRFQRIEGLPTA